jgi:hypothetical protein
LSQYATSPERRKAPRRGEHRPTAKRAAADIEGHSEAAKFGEPGGLTMSRKRTDWSQPLPQPIIIPDLMTLRTLADVRTLLGHLRPDQREKTTWRHVADRLDEAARGASVVEVFALLRTVLTMEGMIPAD